MYLINTSSTFSTVTGPYCLLLSKYPPLTIIYNISPNIKTKNHLAITKKILRFIRMYSSTYVIKTTVTSVPYSKDFSPYSVFFYTSSSLISTV